MEIITEWVKNIFIIILALSFVDTLIPSSTTGKYVKYVFSLIVLSAVLAPLTKLVS